MASREAIIRVNVEGIPAVVAMLKQAEVELIRMAAELASRTAPDGALGRCQTTIQCHLETGHQGPHQGREAAE